MEVNGVERSFDERLKIKEPKISLYGYGSEFGGYGSGYGAHGYGEQDFGSGAKGTIIWEHEGGGYGQLDYLIRM